MTTAPTARTLHARCTHTLHAVGREHRLHLLPAGEGHLLLVTRTTTTALALVLALARHRRGQFHGPATKGVAVAGWVGRTMLHTSNTRCRNGQTLGGGGKGTNTRTPVPIGALLVVRCCCLLLCAMAGSRGGGGGVAEEEEGGSKGGRVMVYLNPKARGVATYTFKYLTPKLQPSHHAGRSLHRHPRG